MKLFVDTANVAYIREVSEWGIIDGCTTNPSLIAKEGRDLKEVIMEITSLVNGPISAEVAEDTAEKMVAEAKPYADLHPNIVIKLPMTMEGIKATKILSKLGIKTNVTLVFTLAQALLAAKAGATYVSPFMGRLDDYVDSKLAGYELIKNIHEVFVKFGYKTEIIAASIRSVEHFEQAAMAGADIATVPYPVLVQLSSHELTTRGLEIFRKDSNS